jgi:hypothetical protein
MTLPQVRHTNSPLGNEHPFVPVVLCRSVWEGKRTHRAPSERLFDYCLHERQIRGISECGRARTADNGIELILSPLLYFWICNHCQCPPG